MNQFSETEVNNPDEVINSIARATMNGFIACNINNKITHFSNKMQDVTGWTEPETLGKDSSEIFQLQDVRSVTDPMLVTEHVVTLFTKDGKQIKLQVRQTGIVNPEGNLEGHLLFFIIENYNKNLDRAQSEFISTVSHELRTPITSIKGFASTLLNSKVEIEKEKREKYIRIIQNQADRLSRLVEDLLAVSRLESKKLQLTIHPVRLLPIVDYVSEVVGSKHKFSHQVNIDCPKDLPEVWVDKDRLEQILTNLIDNAFKYSPESKVVDISIKVDKLNYQDMVRVDITDYGIGIEPENQQKIFTKFSRLDNPLTRVTEGTGLGLYISRSLTKIQGGELKLNSIKGKTTFSVYLPLEAHKGGEIWWD